MEPSNSNDRGYKGSGVPRIVGSTGAHFFFDGNRSSSCRLYSRRSVVSTVAFIASDFHVFSATWITPDVAALVVDSAFVFGLTFYTQPWSAGETLLVEVNDTAGGLLRCALECRLLGDACRAWALRPTRPAQPAGGDGAQSHPADPGGGRRNLAPSSLFWEGCQ